MDITSFLCSMESWLQTKMMGIHTSMPGIVESYDAEKRMAVILPAVNLKVPRGPVVKLQPIQNVPVMFPSSSGFQMVFPLEPGDGVLLLFTESSIGNWMDGAGQVDPEDSTRFSMHDAVAIPGLWSKSKVPKLAHDGDFLLVSKSGARMGGTTEGTLDLSNETTGMRPELEKIWDAINFLGDAVKNLKPVSPAGPCTVDPIIGGPLGTVALQQTSTWDPAKVALGGLLK